jgi:hypothetical protein
VEQPRAAALRSRPLEGLHPDRTTTRYGEGGGDRSGRICGLHFPSRLRTSSIVCNIVRCWRLGSLNGIQTHETQPNLTSLYLSKLHHLGVSFRSTPDPGKKMDKHEVQRPNSEAKRVRKTFKVKSTKSVEEAYEVHDTKCRLLELCFFYITIFAKQATVSSNRK